MPDSHVPRKPPRRFWLFAPYVALAVAIAAWSAVWLAERAAIARTMDQEAEALRGAGWTVAWSERKIDGYPYRLDVSLKAPKIVEPSGWGVSAPGVKAQAYAYHPDVWLAVAAQGATLWRPMGGPVDVKASVLRASAGGLGRGFPRLALEGVDVTFAPQPGAAAFALTTVQTLGLFARSSGADGVEGYLSLAGATAPADHNWLGRMTGGGAFGAISDVLIARVDALKGRDWREAVRHWAGAGGAVRVVRAGLAAGPLHLGVGRGELSADDDGALKGGLVLDLFHPAGFIDHTGGAGPRLVDLTFQAGAATLGPVTVGPAPRVY